MACKGRDSGAYAHKSPLVPKPTVKIAQAVRLHARHLFRHGKYHHRYGC